MNQEENISEHTGKLVSDRLEALIFSGRWLLAPMYIGLMLPLVLYGYKFFAGVFALFSKMFELTDTDLMLGVLHLIDLVMIGNLIIMIMLGGYALFVRRLEQRHDRRLEWLDHVDAVALKVKISMSLIGVSSVHLLEVFVNADQMSTELLFKKLAIHVVFVLSTVAIAWIGRGARHGHSSAQASQGA